MMRMGKAAISEKQERAREESNCAAPDERREGKRD